MVGFSEILIDTITDIYYLIPVLFITYLFLEWIETHTEAPIIALLNKQRHTGPVFGALFGLIPECGLASASSSLYAGGMISAGTLIAVFMSNSDEMLPIMLSSSVSIGTIIKILSVKLVFALLFGFIAELIFRNTLKTCCYTSHTAENDNIFKSALIRTITVFSWIFLITYILNILIEMAGIETLQQFIISHQTKSLLTCATIGLIPNCSPSVLLTSLFIQGVIPFSSLCAGLLMNSGVGTMMLFRCNRDFKTNIKITAYIYICSILAGLLIQTI